MKNILILGSGGMLGYGVSQFFKKKNYNITELTRNEFDVVKLDITHIENYIKKSHFVVNCIGIIKPMIEKNLVLDVFKVNGIFPLNLANICKRNNVKLIHVSTDCVFSGRKGNYNELDYFDAEDIYGISKNCGDYANCMVLRTSFVGPEKGTNRSLLEWAFSQKGKSINGFTNHKWNGVTSIYFAEIVESIINQGLYKEGIFHIGSPDVVTKYELLNIFNEVFNLGMNITPVEATEKCDRSLRSVHEFIPKVVTKEIKLQVRELKEFFKL